MKIKLKISEIFNLDVCFLAWWFLKSYQLLCSVLIGFNNSALISYILDVIILLVAFIINHFKMPKRFLNFSLVYLLFVLINLSISDNQFYVATDAFTSYIFFSVPLYIIACDFSFARIFKKWFKVSVFNLLLVILLVYPNIGTFEYGDIGKIICANIIIVSIGFWKESSNKILVFFMFITNYLILLIYGSRMPAVATAIIFVIVPFVPIEKKTLRKFIIIILISVFIVYFVENISIIFNELNIVLSDHGIYSRTISRFANDIGNTTLLEMVESSHRDEIWMLAEQFIHQNGYMPGGFGVMRSLTNGEVYYCHNIIYDLVVFFGMLIIPILLNFIYRIFKIYKHLNDLEKCIFLIFLLFYIIRGITGTYFLGDEYAIVALGVIYFLKPIKVGNEK